MKIKDIEMLRDKIKKEMSYDKDFDKKVDKRLKGIFRTGEYKDLPSYVRHLKAMMDIAKEKLYKR